ncbi:MAG: glutamine synthetase type III [Planctomycetes bacterium]|nr:glutamine synthetase type III [Planctomycetota bacterium]
MTASTRKSAVRTISKAKDISNSNGFEEVHKSKEMKLQELYGISVFNDAVQRQMLPRSVYQALRRTVESGAELDLEIADAVASAMKEWAIERGATHYTHWFQPMTGLTAEKHDSFLTPGGNGEPLMAFSGKELVRGEPDASSFPSGGIRATFEARGYTAWDPTSPAFLRETADGATLTIPTAFCSWTGEALDKKTPLLRSCEAIGTQAVRLLHLIGEQAVSRVYPTAGAEQEYFLIDREFYFLRPDLVSAGRTLVGAKPPKGQELDDHYFGAISHRVLAFMMEAEQELWKLGVPIKTRHNEVAPSQFEFAPYFEHISVAADHNMLTMEVLQDVAERHGLAALLHEKPFAGVNGSGKHLNWSLCDDLGHNLLDPGKTPHDNLKFILFLCAIIRAVDLHQDLLRASVAVAGNDHRLGANEAPPAIMSIFIGDNLQEVVDSLVEGRAPAQSEAANGDDLRLGVSALPDLPRDATDRNRTSPFAFTGNKFEFRAVASSQSVSYPSTILNTIVAESIDHLANEIEARSEASDRGAMIQEIVRETLSKHGRVLFTGDNYSGDWEAEAQKRGLLNLRTTPEALDYFASEANTALFDKYGVFSPRETASRSNVLYEKYIGRIHIEALALKELASTVVLPTAINWQGNLADSINATLSAAPAAEIGPQREYLEEVASVTGHLKAACDKLTVLCDLAQAKEKALALGDLAAWYCADVIAAMDAVRAEADHLEGLVDDETWPLPKYRELLFVH